MPRNTYFEFKQFRVEQDRCAMKVCTDASLFGAWVARKIPSDARILDIGSGTGLLMLMLAQQTSGTIHGIEIESDAFLQLKENISASPWANRIEAYPGDVNMYPFSQKYHFIVSNPPFYENDLSSSDPRKNAAKHNSTLTLSALIHRIDELLEKEGGFALLLPYHRMEACLSIAAAAGFFPEEILLVKQTPAHARFRSMLLFRKKRVPAITMEIIIRNESGYTEDFTSLLKDYYLHL